MAAFFSQRHEHENDGLPGWKVLNTAPRKEAFPSKRRIVSFSVEGREVIVRFSTGAQTADEIYRQAWKKHVREVPADRDLQHEGLDIVTITQDFEVPVMSGTHSDHYDLR